MKTLETKMKVEFLIISVSDNADEVQTFSVHEMRDAQPSNSVDRNTVVRKPMHHSVEIDLTYPQHVKQFDLLFHRSGPLAGQPRGYAFVTYSLSDEAEKAKNVLDGLLLGTKHVTVRWANSVSKDELEKPKPEITIPALSGAKDEKKVSRQTTIQAIEAKLKMMEHTSVDDFEVNNTPAGVLYAPSRNPSQQSSSQRYRTRARYDSKPYRRQLGRRR